MIIATIKKLDGTMLDFGKFASEEAALQWFQPFIDSGVYGKKYQAAVYKDVQVELSPAVLDAQGNEITPAQFETQTILVSPEVTAEFSMEFSPDVISEEQARAAKIEAGKKAREACQKVLDLISGYNLERELTLEQISQLQGLMQQPEMALRAGRPTMAKLLIAQVNPDGVLVTEEMQQAALDLLIEY